MTIRMEQKEELLNDSLRFELSSFLNSEELKDFIRILKKKEVYEIKIFLSLCVSDNY